ncbi:Cytochrome oxidase biogenesis protein Sco1/SenC/PrrC, thiol-disulfide reductase involved in Cu(I) insertion into CoxII Cu(A) center [hydrothermal vent metagenome]|uniref:Cytochrome oxidase biogenesis protein Sco1/SenC/PrrC, thiol-disulfide reductase involved in Cu(I) insertion into CoxII Cu(A) center n=1 Tax=hydrothermal vent metagenome TaxID=652676 RepID=A0A3B0ZUM1_9ZZZZ
MLQTIINSKLKPLSHLITAEIDKITIFALIVVLFNTPAQANDTHDHHKVQAKKDYTVVSPVIKLTDIEMIDTSNNPVSLTTELNQGPVVINFIFTSCTAICPILSSTFSQVQKRIDEIKVPKLKLVSFSIDPERDTPARLKEYAQKFKAGERWNFYTGTKANMLSVEKIFGNFRGNKMNHLPYTFIRVNANSKWIRLKGFVSASAIIDEINKASTN